ncbi:MAG: hypothetical protein NT070_04265 [Cyanobacteria bacterium]|nr:hypothetical protein [Cyanobacteriota bacterium]
MQTLNSKTSIEKHYTYRSKNACDRNYTVVNRVERLPGFLPRLFISTDHSIDRTTTTV